MFSSRMTISSAPVSTVAVFEESKDGGAYSDGVDCISSSRLSAFAPAAGGG